MSTCQKIALVFPGKNIPDIINLLASDALHIFCFSNIIKSLLIFLSTWQVLSKLSVMTVSIDCWSKCCFLVKNLADFLSLSFISKLPKWRPHPKKTRVISGLHEAPLDTQTELGPHYLCWIFGVVPSNTWLISSWEENNCCYKLSNWQNENYFHSKWHFWSFWVM